MDFFFLFHTLFSETSGNALFWISSVCRVRTSSGMFLKRGRDKIIQNIEKRIADFTFIPVGMSFIYQL